MSKLGNLLSRFILVFFLLTSLLFSCKNSRKAKPMPAEISSYIYAYTSGTISKNAPIRVRFTNAVIEKEKIGGEVGSIISFSPSINGKAIWEDDRTILMEPKTPLSSKTNYLGSIKLDKLYKNLPKGLSTFEFDFQTRELYFDVVADGLRSSDMQDLSKQSLTGTVNMSDVTENGEVEKLLKAYQEDKELTIKWVHNNEKLRHDFVIDGIIRGEKESNLLLKWNGSPIDLSINGELKIPVSSKNDFLVASAKVVQEKEQTILVFFTEPIQQNQDLNGMINLDNNTGNLTYAIDGNIVRIYPAGRISGQHNLFIAPGIKSISGNTLKNPTQWALNFENATPQVRLVGRGVIMPNSDGLIFPFEAISLNAVDIEIFKIFNNNILQFLQTNNIEGDYDLERVGRIVFQKKVSLKEINSNANNNEWTRYSVDLSKFIKNDPSAIYQIRIGFRQEYSNYSCGNDQKKVQNKNYDLLFTKEETDENGEVKSILGDYYGSDGYYDGYRWEDRTNPCKQAYYNSDKFIKRNVFSSNIGIIAKGGNDHSYFVAVSDIRTTEPIAGAKLEFFDYQNQLMKTAITDNNGMAMLEFEKNPFVVIVTKGDQKGYLKLGDGTSLSLSKFDIAGVETQKGLKGYLYGERGVWRPGDSLYLNFVLEDKGNKLPNGYPVSFELQDAKGQLFYKTTTTNNVNNVYPFHIATNTESPTGTWMTIIKVGGAKFFYPLKIETVKPNRLKLSLDFGKSELSAGNSAEIGNLQANWLHGSPASGLNAKVETQLKSVPTKFEKYPSYNFDDPSRKFTVAEPQVIYNGNLDATGNAKVGYHPAPNFLAPGKLKVDFKVRVFEKGGDFSTDNFSMAYHPYNFYVGVDIPIKDGEKRVDIKKNAKISFVIVGKDGKPIADRSLKIGLYRCDWRWWWDQGDDNISQFNSSTHLGALKQELVKTNQKGEATWTVNVNDWGRYLVRAVDEIGGHSTGDFFYAGYPWYDDNNQATVNEAATMLSFSSAKEKYKVGENIELKIPTGEAGKVLITLENGSRVVDYYWKEAKAGENTIRITAKPEFAPTVYAHVTLIQPHAQTKNDLPIRMYGVTPIGVEDPNTILKPAITMPDEVRPDKDFTVEVSEKTGNNMAYTLAIVDDGLLDLTRFKTPNPWDAFYAREALGVKTWDIYDQVLGAFGGELERILSIGGDGINYKAASQRKANRFKPVVMHLGPFFLEKGKTAKHNIKISNYVGSVRAMVVACNKGAYGNAEKTVAVKNPLMILATLPRVLSPGEKLQLPVNVFVMDKKIKNVDITVKESNELVSIGTSTKSLSFKNPGDDLATFAFDVKNKQGVAKFKIVAKSGNEISMQDIEVEVRNPNPYVTDIVDGMVDGGKSWTTNYNEIGTSENASAMLEVSSLPPLNLTARLDYLVQYPHGCVEQTTSGAFPQLFLDKLMSLDNTKKQEINYNIKAAIEKLKLFQTDAGGFGYWPGESAISHWSTNYVGHFLLEARLKGYTIPYNMIERWQRYQQKVAQRWDPALDDSGYSFESKDLNQAYRLYTLALAKAPELGAMNRLKERLNLSVAAKWRLAAAFAISGKVDVAKQIIANVAYKVTPYTELSYTYGSEVRDLAMILETMTLIGDKMRGAEVLKDLSVSMGSESWYSTQTTAYTLMAASKFVGNTGYDSKCSFSYQVGAGETTNAGSNNGIMQIKIPSNGKKVTVKNNGNGMLFTRLVMKGKPISNEAPSASKNMNLTVNFKSTKGENINPSKIAQGTDFVAEVIVNNPGTRGIDYQEVALTQVFPSGWEIRNTRMDNITNLSNSSIPRYQDIRDDRVNTYFDLRKNNTQIFRIQLNAAYIGRYYLPGTVCETMYDNSIYARKQGQWVEVIAKN
ncbi:MAG: hypothetical protein IPL95_05740 [Saprospiraceae bacterium]|nr:hypothetical protein [Saprospiraceae bacterium]